MTPCRLLTVPPPFQKKLLDRQGKSRDYYFVI